MYFYSLFYRKATRATLILVPLLGLQYLLFPIRPEPDSQLQDVYHIAVALLVSLQVFHVDSKFSLNEKTYSIYMNKYGYFFI